MGHARIGEWTRLLSVLVLLVVAATSHPTRAGTELPGVGDGTITPETLFAWNASIKMIAPPAGLPQKWFSAEAEFRGTVATATDTGVVLVEPMTESEHAGRSIRISGSSAAAGQIRQIASNSSDQIEITSPFDIVPEPGDSVEIFTGDLPPGRWNGACTPADPCLDFHQVHLFGIAGAVWIWFDAGDVWDSDAEWCDVAHSPPGRCPMPSESFQRRFIADEFHDPAIENEIRWGISGTDLTGATFPVIDCDSNSYYPPFGGGLFENQNGSAAPAAQDGPTPWMVIQGIETRCWNRPAPGAAASVNEWGEGNGVYRQEFSGKILAIHNRHGDLWDGSALVSGGGASFTQGDLYQGGVILVDIEANTADYAQVVGQCTATNTPYRSCQGTDFTGQGRGQDGGDIRPRFVDGIGGGDVLWVGGDTRNRNKSSGPYTGWPRNFIEVYGFNSYLSNSGVGGTQHVTLVNLQLAGAPGDLVPADIVFALPSPNRWGTTYELRILNSRFTDMPEGAAIVRFVPGWTTDRARNTSLQMDWANVSVERYGSVFVKDAGVVGREEIDGGFDWTGRCLFFDAAKPTPGVNRILDIQSSTESLDVRCMLHSIDVEGWIDGDDVADQFSLCFEDVASYASEAMTGTMMQPGNAGDVNGWEIFSQGDSGDWGGEGVDIDARAALETSPEVQNAVLGACNHAETYPLGQTLPIGFISTPDNLISNITVAGVRDLGFNASEDAPTCTAPPDEPYITTATLDGNARPVIHYADPDPPADVTGYNVYRASAPTGPWTRVGADVGDHDGGTPDLQYVDWSGHTGERWYYAVAAWNETCEAEGPW